MDDSQRNIRVSLISTKFEKHNYDNPEFIFVLIKNL